MSDMDFPLNPFVGQKYTNDADVTYEWDGTAWIVGFYDVEPGDFTILGDVLSQVRILLQDTDLGGGAYRYSTDSLVNNVNMGMREMYRIRPDIFLELGFQIPTFSSTQLDQSIGIEEQHVPALVYYAVGMAQLRDDEPEQDTRASMFLGKFTSMLVAVA